MGSQDFAQPDSLPFGIIALKFQPARETNVKRIICSTSSGGDGSGGDSSRGGGSERRCGAWHSSPAELFVLGRTLEEPVYCADVRRSQRCHDRIHPVLYAHGEQQKGRAAEGQGSRRAGQQKGS